MLIIVISIVVLFSSFVVGAFATNYLPYKFLGQMSWSDGMVVKFTDGNVNCYTNKMTSPTRHNQSTGIDEEGAPVVALSCVTIK